MITSHQYSSDGTQVLVMGGSSDGWACWVAVDDSKAYDSASHPMLRALLTFIQFPPAWVHVLTQILQEPVLFLVGGGVVREEELRPSSGIRQGDPLSPIIFSLVTSLIIYVLRLYDATV